MTPELGCERLLSPETLAKADLRGSEYAWCLEDVPVAIADARGRGLATIGGQAQFRLDDATCELYWLAADADSRRADEPWRAYVDRSAEQVLARFGELISGADFLAEAASFPVLVEERARGVDLRQFLRFVLYFDEEPGRGSPSPSRTSEATHRP